MLSPAASSSALMSEAGEDAIRHSAVDDILTEFKAIEQRRRGDLRLIKPTMPRLSPVPPG
ncbi:MAG: hypothetical protein R3F53_29490 [Gammaproteobacteria bacterium]